MSEQLDIIILGGGTAGMTAAIYARRANLRVLLLETNICGGLVNSTYMVENFPSQQAIHGMELMELMRDQVLKLGVRIEEVCAVQSLDLNQPIKKVHTDLGIFEAPALVLATGRKPLPLQVVHSEDCEQIHYCAICDGAPYQGKKVLVVGGGNSGFDEALYLMNLGIQELTLVEAMPRFFAAQAAQDALLAKPGTLALYSTTVKALHMPDGKLEAVELEREGRITTLAVDAIFVFMGQSPQTEFLHGHMDLDEQGYIPTTEKMEATLQAAVLPGVYAAGDVRQKMFRQITTAMSDGTIAALCAERFIHSSGH